MTAEDWGVETGEEYWYNTQTGEVEKGKLSPSVYRVGPFPTAAEAQAAPDKLQQRADAWKAEEAEEDDWGRA
ncbi:hypothetical protein [Canibacter zhoujuaniae]|nr:hypothetical protein [Canibacter zhoujuaniae]